MQDRFVVVTRLVGPRVVLRPTLREDDWLREVKQEISSTQPEPSPGAKRN